jgi:hypothetical protein
MQSGGERNSRLKFFFSVVGVCCLLLTHSSMKKTSNPGGERRQESQSQCHIYACYCELLFETTIITYYYLVIKIVIVTK